MFFFIWMFGLALTMFIIIRLIIRMEARSAFDDM